MYFDDESFMTKYYLFDLDGTLTDSSEGITNCIAHALEQLGHGGYETEALQQFIGPPLQASFAQMLKTEDPAKIDRAVALYRERFAMVGLYENRVYSGIVELLSALREVGHIAIVATSKPEVFARKIIRHFQLDGYFDAIYGSELDGTRADKADLIAHVLKEEGLDPAQVFMIGDRHHDMHGAVANGVTPIGVTWGFGSEQELGEAGAARVIDKPRDMLL